MFENSVNRESAQEAQAEASNPVPPKDQPAAAPVTVDLLKAPQIELREVASLKTNKRNARTHNDKQIGQITKSITEFGFVNPILLDGKAWWLRGTGVSPPPRSSACRRFRPSRSSI